MISKLIYPILFVNICQSLLVNLNSIQENYILFYIMICYEIIIIISFITYLYYNSKYKIENDKHKKLFEELNKLNKKYEMEIRKKLIEKGHLDIMISISSNFFYTVTLPVTLWFFDKGKPEDRKNKVLFIDAREIYNQVDRAHRDFKPEQLEFVANIIRLYRGNEVENTFIYLIFF